MRRHIGSSELRFGIATMDEATVPWEADGNCEAARRLQSIGNPRNGSRTQLLKWLGAEAAGAEDDTPELKRRACALKAAGAAAAASRGPAPSGTSLAPAKVGAAAVGATESGKQMNLDRYFGRSLATDAGEAAGAAAAASRGPAPAKGRAAAAAATESGVQTHLDRSLGRSSAMDVEHTEYFERQSAGWCGMHALNNHLGGPYVTPDDCRAAAKIVVGQLSEVGAVGASRISRRICTWTRGG